MKLSSLLCMVGLTYPVFGADATTCETAPAGESTGTKIVLTNGEWEPFQGQGLPKCGVASHVVREAFKVAGMGNVQFEWLPWNRAFNEVAEGRLQGSLVWGKTPERESKVLFSEPVMTHEMVNFFVKGNKKIENLLKVNDPYEKRVEGLAVGILLGSKATELEKLEAAKKVTLNRCAKLQACFQMLLEGRVDIVAQNKLVGMYELKAKANNFTQGDRDKIDSVKSWGDSIWEYRVIFKKADDGPKLLEAFNKGLKTMQDSGSFKQIFADFEEGKFDKK